MAGPLVSRAPARFTTTLGRGGRVPLVPLMAPQGAIILSVKALKKPWNVQSRTAALSALRGN